MKAIRHTGIVVNDLERAMFFYRDMLGLKVVKQIDECGVYLEMITGLKGVKITTVKMSADDGNLIELLKFYSHPCDSQDRNINTLGISHVAFTVDNVEAEYLRLLNQGILFVSAPQISPNGYAKVAFCRDPDGTFIELVEVLQTNEK